MTNLDKWKSVRDFFNKPKDQKFNDHLMASILVEIRLIKPEFNEDLELPCKSGICAPISAKVPLKVRKQIEELIQLGNKQKFITYTKAKIWLHEETGIQLYNLSSLPLNDDEGAPDTILEWKAKSMWNKFSVQ